MHFVKLIPITAITAAMGLVACGDSSSNAGIESCKVISENPLTLETVQQGVSVKITIDLIKDKAAESTAKTAITKTFTAWATSSSPSAKNPIRKAILARLSNSTSANATTQINEHIIIYNSL